MNNISPIRGDVYWVELDPTVGTEINKTRPCVIISNNVQNQISSRVIVAPITSSVTKVFSFEVKILINDVAGKILLDQLRSIDKVRLKKRITIVGNNIIPEIDKALKLILHIT